MARALQPANNNSANNSNQEKETVVPLVTTYHLRRKDLNRLMIERNLQYLYVDQVVMKVFTPASFVYFGKRCLVCLNVSEVDTFESFQTKKQCKTNRNLNCNDECLIYLCKIFGLQYIGSTTDPFRYHYKDNN